MGNSMVNVLPRAPSGTAVDRLTAMFPSGTEALITTPDRYSSKYPVRETSNFLKGTISQRSLSILPAHSGSLQLDVHTMYSQFKTYLKRVSHNRVLGRHHLPLLQKAL